MFVRGPRVPALAAAAAAGLLVGPGVGFFRATCDAAGSPGSGGRLAIGQLRGRAGASAGAEHGARGVRETPGGHAAAAGEASGAISGSVTASEVPAPNAQVRVYSSSGPETTVASSCETGSDGRYDCRNLSPGTYDVRVSAVVGYANQVRYLVDVVDGGTTSGVDFTLANGTGTISGTVLDPDDEPLPGATVQAFLKESPGTWGVSRTDDNGRYVIADMWGGSYLITVDHPALARMTRDGVPVAGVGRTVVNLPGGGATAAGGPPCDMAASVSSPAATLIKGRIAPNGRLALKGSIPGPRFTPSVAGLTFAIVDGNGGGVCAEVPAPAFVRRRHGRVISYKDDAASRAGVRSIRLRRSGSGGFKFVVKGKGMALLRGGPATVTFGFVSGDFAAGGAAVMRSHGRGYVYP